MIEMRLDALFRHCRSDIERFFGQRLDTPALAEDLSQETFLRLLCSAPKAAIRDARAYLFRIANNLLVDYYRSRSRCPQVACDEALLEAIEDPAPQPDIVVENQQMLKLLQQAIDSLPPRGREVFILHKFHHMEYSQIAEKLDISPNTVMVHMARALMQCRNHLQRQVMEDQA